MTERILVTGFRPFLSHETNPSEDAVLAFGTECLSGVITAVLPVDVDAGPRRALELATGQGVSSVIALGLDAARPTVSIERIAVNLYEHGAVSHPLTVGGPAAYWSTLPTRDLEAAIAALEVPVQQSLSAGAYVCNATLYRLLEAGLHATFIHLPTHIDAATGARVIAAAVEVARSSTARASD